MTTAATERQEDWDLIPPAVRAKVEEMSKFTSPDPNAPKEDEEKPPAAGEPETPEPAPVQSAPSEPEPKKEPDTTPAPAAQPLDLSKLTFADLASEEMTKEQRYKIMEGMQRAIGRDLSRAQREANALRGEVEALKQQLNARTVAPTPAAPTPGTAAPSDGHESLKEAFGEKNLMDMVQFLRSQGFAVTQDVQQISQRVGQVGSVVEATAYSRFEDTMSSLTDGQWLTVNEDPRFIAWTEEPEGRTGIPRIEFMKRALAERNATALAPYFTDFIAEFGGAPAEAAPAPRPTIDKKKLAAPKATPAATRIVDAEKPMVKVSEFTKLEADVRAGKYTSDDPVKQVELTKQLAAERARLDEAQRSNRVVAG